MGPVLTLTGAAARTEVVASDALGDGRVRHHLSDGRTVVVGPPTYDLEYRSMTSGSFRTQVSLAGLSAHPGCFDTWNYDQNGPRTYAFAKTIALTHLQTGERWTADELQAALSDGRTERTA